MTTSVLGLSFSNSRLFYITDKLTGHRFLIDTGAEVSVIPPSQSDRLHKQDLVLQAANNTSITTYGRRSLTLNLGLGQEFQWIFIVADVKHPILGIDFLRHYALIVDVRRQQLLDAPTQSKVKVTTSSEPSINITLLPRTPANSYEAILHDFPSVIQPFTEQLPVQHNVTHHISTTGPPVCSRARRLAPERLNIARKEFEHMLQLGIVRPSSSSWASPLHMVPKKSSGDWRTPFGLFEFLRTPFGLRNAAQTFQRFINEVLRGLHFSYAYIDYVLIASATPEEHRCHLHFVLERFQKHGIVINPSKCKFGVKELEFLGYTVNKHGIRPLEERVLALKCFPQPTTKHKLREFLGLVNFYHRFVPGCANILQPLNAMLSTAVGVEHKTLPWTQTHTEAFTQIKEALARASMLYHPKPDAPTCIMADASDKAVGAVLQQRFESNIIFLQKIDASRNTLSAFDRELLAIYLAIRHFRHFVEGRQFHVLSDHKPLADALSSDSAGYTPRQVHHLDYISQFTSDIQHVKGVHNAAADALSRIEVCSLGDKPEGIDFTEMALAQGNDPDTLQLLNGTNTSSSLVLQAIPLENKDLTILCDVSTGVPRPVVPVACQQQVFNALHSMLHPGIRATQHLVTTRFVWPGINSDVRHWTRACLQCQRSKVHRHTVTPLATFATPDACFSAVHLDLVGPLPPSKGHSYLLTVIDRFTCWPEAIPIPDITAITAAQAFISGWVSRFGIPATITTDQGRQFESVLWTELMHLLGSS